MLKNLLFLLLACVLFFNPQIYGQKKFTLSDKIDFAKQDEAKNNISIGIETEEPSAIVPIEDGKYFLAANDKSLKLTVISNDTRRKVGTAKCPDKESTCENFPKTSPKWEAMAADGEDIYAIGAQRFNTKEPKILLRFRIHKISESKIEIYSVVKIFINGLFDDFINTADDPQIEGLAVKNYGNKKEILVGIRNLAVDKKLPKATQNIFIRQIIFDEKDIKLNSLNTFKSENYFHFDAGVSKKDNFPFHLSSLEYIPQLKGFLIITATEDLGNKFFGNALWFMSDAEIEKKTFNAVKISDKDFEPEMKAEGLCLVSVSENIYRLAITFDNDNSQTTHLSKLYFYDLTVAEQTQSPQTKLP